MELVYSPRDICFSFGITYTSRNRIILLLLLLVWPARSACQPLQLGKTHYTIVDDDVEKAPIYRCAPKPTRPHEESWPGNSVSTYTVGESSKATVKVICSPYPRIIRKIFQNPGDTGMYIISVAILRLDTTHGTTDWNVQNRSMHNNSWLMTLPFDVDNTGCHMPPFQRSDVSSKHLKYYWDDYIFPNHYTSFTQMLSLSYICLWQVLSTCFLPQHLRIFQSHFITTTMNTADYWLMAREYGIWNAAIESLQFWAEDLDPITLV